jgi:lysophospholipase L1-like esterase
LVSITIGINDLEWWNLSRVRDLLDGDRETFETWLRDAVSSVRAAVAGQVARLLTRRGVSVVLTEYYDPFNQGSPLFLLCADPAQCRDRTEEAVTALNRELRALVRPRVRVASVQARFEGHEAARPRCGLLAPGSARTWIQPDCLHPNSRGAEAIATAVDREARGLGH